MSYSALQVKRSKVVGAVTPTCTPKPRQHTILVELQFSVGGHWIGQGPAMIRHEVPDETGFAVQVSGPCQEGVYRLRIRASGIGPDGIAFDYAETGPETRIALAQCAG